MLIREGVTLLFCVMCSQDRGLSRGWIPATQCKTGVRGHEPRGIFPLREDLKHGLKCLWCRKMSFFASYTSLLSIQESKLVVSIERWVRLKYICYKNRESSNDSLCPN